ncbi:DUF3942 family protein [Bacillus cereus]|uniref:DUF3942 family protein n=1 Tax=Bacillus cereus TaxID=1396 RepID=UPI0015C050A2|nr:DUF3942 family protein [Bacillus cereus]MCU5048380.1 DUF3942 family protein [Bacillus cereus]MCU5650871.1 DUF3942 family protein [Bacillus cereus]QLF04352.1 DUF3942 domain-containing protein [Bacillus cereus]
MNKLDNFIERTKAYVVTDLEEKLLLEKFKEEVIPYMERIKASLDSVEGYDYFISVGDKISKLKIHGKEFVIMIESGENCITINAHNKADKFVEVERIILKEGNLFSTKRKQIFTEDILVDYLNETFESIIGQ